MKVYVICSGVYSDKVINFVTLDKDKAEMLREIAERNDWDSNAWIDEFDTDKSDEAVAHGNDTLYRVSFLNASYTIAESDATDEGLYDDKNGAITVWVFAKNGEEALKIASERRAEHLAEKEGLTSITRG